jgi:RNA-binding protein
VTPLSNTQIRALKARAQRLDATLRLGRAGLTADFIGAVDRELTSHELVKLKFIEHKEQRRELADRIAAETHSHLVWVIGHVAVFFRAKPPSSEDSPSADPTPGARPAKA